MRIEILCIRGIVLEILSLFDGEINSTTDSGEEELASTTSFVNCNLIMRNFYETSLAILTWRYINFHFE